MPARKRQVRNSKKSGPGSAWLWFFSGLVCGLLGATLALQAGWIKPPSSLQLTTPSPSGSETAAPADNNDEIAPRQYDFYSVLPEQDNPIPAAELQRAAQQNIPEPAAAAPITGDAPNGYILQVAAFRNAEDADNLKAELGLLGFTASIQAVTIDSNNWHRVRIGPIAAAAEADSIRAQLASNGYQVQVFQQ